MNRICRIPLLVPWMPRAERLLPYLKQIDENRWYTNFGPLNAEFERRLLADCAPHLGPTNITTVSNCTVGLELALQALNLPAGSTVLIPAITFVATATAVIRVGLEPVIGDVDPYTWALGPEQARQALAHGRVDAVMPVATFGYAHDTNEWDRFTSETGIPVVIDAAGAYGNQQVGHTTDVVYSFHATKSFGAAEGGAVLSAEESRIATIRKLANFGIDTSTGLLAGKGTNGKMSEYHCAIGLASFDEWEHIKQQRRRLYRFYVQALADRAPSACLQRKDPNGVYPVMPVLLPAGATAERVRAQLTERGVETRRWYAPGLHLHPALRSAPTAGDLPHATALGERIIGLPFFMGMTDEQVVYVCSHLQEAINESRVQAP